MVGETDNQFLNFNRMMTKLLKTPHSEIKAKLDAERVEKQKKKRKLKTSASGRVSGGDKA